MKKLILAAALTALAAPVFAQSVSCMPREALVASLENTHNERLNGGGLQNALNVIEVWSSDQTGSFTVFVTRADGMSCIVATGQNWHNMPPPEPTPEGDPT